MLRAQNVHTQRSLIHEVDGVGSRRNVVVREQHAPCEFEIWRNPSVMLEVPLQPEWIKSDAVCGVCWLKCQKQWNCIEGVFESSPQKAWQVCVGENPSVTQTGVKDTGVAAPAADGMSPSRPDLNLMPALFRSSLCREQRRGQQQESQEYSRR